MAISVFDRVENIVGKGEIACISNFSFSLDVVKRLLSQTHQKVLLYWNGLIPYHTMPHFDALQIIAVENIVRKGEIDCNKQFFLFSQCFLHHIAIGFYFNCTLKCHMQFVLIWPCLKFCCLVMD